MAKAYNFGDRIRTTTNFNQSGVTILRNKYGTVRYVCPNQNSQYAVEFDTSNFTKSEHEGHSCTGLATMGFGFWIDRASLHAFAELITPDPEWEV